MIILMLAPTAKENPLFIPRTAQEKAKNLDPPRIVKIFGCSHPVIDFLNLITTSWNHPPGGAGPGVLPRPDGRGHGGGGPLHRPLLGDEEARGARL